ncbi:YncE family protein [Streptococcus saliviloxodontae]|uniref:Lipoprotein n=1 Tax=Streptococcus saliviloxodontae TaxID=1349416 RepID=A0ABS2PLF6_9STRE|nr:hypothetical protein [Streptococcus saliviloxodontae]MBM7636270.1 hypothetical protein [Streptococcus saliviloxodontae]
MTKKRLLGSIVALAGIAVGGYLFATRPSNIPQTLVNGTNTNPASYTEKDFLKRLQSAYPQVASHLDKGDEKETYVIPGLEKTQAIIHSGKKAGQGGIATDMDPQGMAIIEDKYILISAYSKSKKYNSVLWLLDKKTGKYLKTIALDDIDHVGALTYDDANHRLWVATVDKEGDAQIEALNLSSIENYDLNKSKTFLPFDASTDLNGVRLTSYLTYHKGTLYVGYFDQNSNGTLAAFPMDNQGFLQASDTSNGAVNPSKTWLTYNKIQGISFYEDKILLSQSYGSKNSKLLIFDNKLDDPKFDLDKGDAITSMTLPPYLEQIIGHQDKVYLLFESASHLYRQKKGILHMDRVIKIKIEDLYHH